MRCFRLAVLAVLAAIVGACAVPGAPPTAGTLDATLGEPAPTRDDGRYVNVEGGFSLVLPEGWSAAGPFPISIEGGASYNLYTVGIDPSGEGGPGTSRMFVADAAVVTLEEFVLQQCSICPEHPVEETTLGGTPARAAVIGGGSVPFEVEWFFVEHSGKLIGLSIIDPETMQTLGPVVQSFRLE